jgi:hypothetical protein
MLSLITGVRLRVCSVQSADAHPSEQRLKATTIGCFDGEGVDLVDFWLTWSRDFARALTHVPLRGVPTPSLFAGVSAVSETESAE